MDKLSRAGITPHCHEMMYCRECADELFRDTISSRPAQLFSAGPGCPMEHGGSDDPSPWEENNVRLMEDG